MISGLDVRILIYKTWGTISGSDVRILIYKTWGTISGLAVRNLIYKTWGTISGLDVRILICKTWGLISGLDVRILIYKTWGTISGFIFFYFEYDSHSQLNTRSRQCIVPMSRSCFCCCFSGHSPQCIVPVSSSSFCCCFSEIYLRLTKVFPCICFELYNQRTIANYFCPRTYPLSTSE